MTILVTDQGFQPAGDTPFTPLAEMGAETVAVDLANTDDPDALAGHLDRLTAIRVAFPAFSDGRGFTIARRLRMLGFQARLRAFGHVIADQYAMARRVGFDEVEIPDELAARQPEAQWLARADWNAHHYQAHLQA